MRHALRRTCSRLALAAAVSLAAGAAQAETKTLAGKASAAWEMFYTGLAEASAITGSAEADVIYGDALAMAGPPVAMKRLVMGRDASGAPMLPDKGVYLSSMGPGVVSPDGRWVLVNSQATNLLPGLTPGMPDQVLAVHLETGEIVPVSVGADGTTFGDGDSGQAKFSPDGSKVVFVTAATNLVGASAPQVVVKDLKTGAITRVSGTRGTGAAVTGKTFEDPSFSPDGSRIVFETNAALLDDPMPDMNGASDVYMVTYTGGANDAASTVLVSTRADGSFGDLPSYGPVFSPLGDGILFSSLSNLLTSPQMDTNSEADVYFKALGPVDPATGRMSGPVSLVSSNDTGTQGNGCLSYEPGVHPDGRRVAFTTLCPLHPAPDTNGTSDVYFTYTDRTVEEKKGGTLLGVSGLPAKMGDAASYSPNISPDGSLIAFVSQAGDLAAGATNGKAQVLVRSFVNGAPIHLVSRAATGAAGDDDADWIAFTPDGAGIVFESAATNLVDPPTSETNVYLATLPPVTGGNDVILGGAGDDRIHGGGGDDTLDGGAGADRMTGGPGNDSYIVDDPGDVVAEKAGEGIDDVISAISWTLPDNVENLELVAPAVEGAGNALANVIEGSAGANVLSGGAGDDSLFGNGGADTLAGGDGNDRLIGGGGRDILTGGAGVDTFVWLKRAESRAGKSRRDVITDFDAAAGETIDLSKVDGKKKKGFQRFIWKGAKPFSGRPGRTALRQGPAAGGRRRRPQGGLRDQGDGDLGQVRQEQPEAEVTPGGRPPAPGQARRRKRTTVSPKVRSSSGSKPSGAAKGAPAASSTTTRAPGASQPPSASEASDRLARPLP